jgi:hypothetical protein
VAGFQESLVAALVIAIAATVLLVSIGAAIGSESARRNSQVRVDEAERLISSIESSVAFDDGVLDLSRSGAIANVTQRAAGGCDGLSVTLDLALDRSPEIELGRRGGAPGSVENVVSRSIPVEVRMPSGMTAGVMVVTLWWE